MKETRFALGVDYRKLWYFEHPSCSIYGRAQDSSPHPLLVTCQKSIHRTIDSKQSLDLRTGSRRKAVRNALARNWFGEQIAFSISTIRVWLTNVTNISRLLCHDSTSGVICFHIDLVADGILDTLTQNLFLPSRLYRCSSEVSKKFRRCQWSRGDANFWWSKIAKGIEELLKKEFL